MTSCRPDVDSEMAGHAAEVVSRLLEAGEAVLTASRELSRRMSTVARSLNRRPRVVVGFNILPDGTPQPHFVSTPAELAERIATWRQTVIAAGGAEAELGTVEAIGMMLAIDLNADIARLAEEQAAKRIPEAVDAFNAAMKAQEAARRELSRVRPSGLAEARLLAEVIATDIRRGVDPACLGQMAVNLERTLAEMLHGRPQKLMMDA